MKYTFINLLEMYKKALEEDAMVAASAPAGEVVGGSTAVGDIVDNSDGITADEVLGNCDHHKDGYLGPKCFHVPKRCGKLQGRIELPSKKKKDHKNPYIKNAKMIKQ